MSARYNGRVFVRTAGIVLILSAGILGQSTPPSCPAGRPVDDIIAEVHKQQSKMKNRNTNPFAVPCIFGWCRGGSRTPPTLPEPAQQAEFPANGDQASSSSNATKTPINKCDDAMETALEAAHNVDVGDTYFAGANYKAAQLRYQDALEALPSDAAIHVRLGRVFEKLNRTADAVEEYKAAQKLAGPQKYLEEAEKALARLQAPHS
jgi:tetratricopeptide (TPR) repeat protein